MALSDITEVTAEQIQNTIDEGVARAKRTREVQVVYVDRLQVHSRGAVSERPVTGGRVVFIASPTGETYDFRNDY